MRPRPSLASCRTIVTTAVTRHRDGQTSRQDLARHFLVECPRCRGPARVSFRTHAGDEIALDPGTRLLPHDPPLQRRGRRRMTCRGCGHADDSEMDRPPRDSVSHDWYYQRPLFLQRSCCGQVLYAYNLEHLEWLASYVGATLREGARHHHGMAARLPRWIKAAGNRDQVLRCIEQLRERARDAGL